MPFCDGIDKDLVHLFFSIVHGCMVCDPESQRFGICAFSVPQRLQISLSMVSLFPFWVDVEDVEDDIFHFDLADMEIS